ncbi:Protein FAM21C [Heterocephalus glaber]|uniref:Protein FAM21C n=1 Tax=Heterocephalus glaber TaxID=10181 RepID=G5ATS3_HETGA|nr:Protein FAM21C [Heterocephalus glaber]
MLRDCFIHGFLPGTFGLESQSKAKMNQTTPDLERAPASEAEWERPWSVEEIRRSSQNWSLAADAGLLQFLQEFSQQTISRTHEIKKQVDGLIRETKATDCRLHNVFNDFLMLSNTQFIENRVYDEELEEPVLKVEAEKTEQEKTREQKEVDLIPKVQEAVNYGLQVLDSAFEQLDIKAGNSDSEEDDINERVELILEPKDLYIDRPLPYLIGSKLFMEQEDVGLGELSSEEGSVGSDRGSIVDSDAEKEEEESEDDFANQSDNDQNQHTTQMSDEEEDDDADLFADSENEEDIEDADEDTKPKKPMSFADELAARIKGDGSRLGEEQADEEDNLFAPPKLTDEDFLPFGSRGGLFSGGQGLFDDEDESDLFREAPQDWHTPTPVNDGDTDVFGAPTSPVLKEPQKPEQPTLGKSSCVPPTSGLFDDDDDDDDDFFTASSSKPSKTDKIKSTANIFDDEEGDLFKEKAAAVPKAAGKQTSGKQWDESKAELKARAEQTDNLFGAAAAKKQMPSPQIQSQEKVKPLEQPKKKASALLFSSDEEDQWSITDTQTKPASDSKSTGELGDTRTSQGQWAVAMKKTSLFEEDDEDDLFAIAKDSQKKTQRVSLLFEDDVDNGSSLFGSPATSTPPVAMKKETAHKALPLLFSDEEEKEPQFGVRPVAQKAESPRTPSALQGISAAEKLEKKGLLTTSAQEAIRHSDLFFPATPLDKGTTGRTKTVLSLFDEEEDKMEDPDSTRAPQTEVGKGPDPDARPKSTGVFQDEELLFSHKLQKDNDPDVDLFAGTKKNRVPEKKVVKKFHSVISSKNQKHPESTQSSKEKSIWKPETEQANLAINPTALLPGAPPQVLGAKPVSPELALPSSEPGRSLGVDSHPAAPGHGEAGVSFDLPAQADTLHSANKSRVKVRGKRRPQTRAARRLAAQVSSEAEDAGVPRGSITQLAEGATLPSGRQLQPRATSMQVKSEQAVAAATPPRESGPVPAMDRSPFVMALGQPRDETDLFDSEDIFSKGTRSQFTERAKAKVKDREISAHLAEGGKERSPLFPALGEVGSNDDLFQSVKPRSAKKTNPFPLLDDEDDLFTDQKGKNEPKPSSQQEVVSKTQDIFEDDIFAIEAIKTSQKKREERNLEPSLLDDNIDIFADLTLKPKRKSKNKVEAKSIFDDDMDDIFSSSGLQTKTTKPKNQSAQTTPEPKSKYKVSNIFDDPLNAFGGQ